MFGKHFAYEYAGSNEEGWTPPWLRREGDWQGPRHHGHGHRHGGHRHEHRHESFGHGGPFGPGPRFFMRRGPFGHGGPFGLEVPLGLAVQEKAPVSSGVEISSSRCWSFCKSDLCMGMR